MTIHAGDTVRFTGELDPDHDAIGYGTRGRVTRLHVRRCDGEPMATVEFPAADERAGCDMVTRDVLVSELDATSRPGEGHDHSWASDVEEVEACCPDFNAGLTGTGIRCPGDPEPEPEPETEAAADLSKPLARLDERVTHFGLAWMTSGPRGRQWAIGWQQAKGEVKGWDYKTGRTGFLGTASGVEEARAEALRIAGLIAAGKTRG